MKTRDEASRVRDQIEAVYYDTGALLGTALRPVDDGWTIIVLVHDGPIPETLERKAADHPDDVILERAGAAEVE